VSRRTALAALALAALLAIAAGWWLLRPPAELRVNATVVQSGLDVPWDVAFAPDGRMLVTERAGFIRVFASGDPGAARLASAEVPDVRAEGEAGLMGIAVDPGPDGWVYVCASRDPDGEGDQPWLNQVLRYRLSADSELTLDGVLFDGGMRAHIHHNGCAVELDATGHLWLTMGDANTGSGANLAQEAGRLNGKVLRLSTDGSIPNDNPVLPGNQSPTAAWSMGHRNPQGLAFGPDGLLVAPEHGTDVDDELNAIVRGGNHGYGCFTGFETRGPATTWCEGTQPADFREPLWASGSPTLATSGATFLGPEWGEFAGSLVVTTLKEADLRRFELSGDGSAATLVQTLLDEEFGRLRAAVIGPGGTLYLTTSNADGNDRVIRVTPG
jgi:glucose/arabinose dehydrogenase